MEEKDVAQYRSASGSALHQPVQVATVMEHAPAVYRVFERYQAWSAYVIG